MFKDDDEIKKGEYLKLELEKLIYQSKILIIMISKDYASSTWCLDELVMVLEQRRNFRHLVLLMYEAKFIQKIIKVIGDKLRHATLDVAPYKIGIDSRAKSINMWLQDESTDDRVRAMCVMSGIRKTTITKFVYNQNSNSFDDIFKKQCRKIHNVDEGLAKIKNLVCSKRVLLVLDDVEQADQIYTIFGIQDWLFPGSKVIKTTRHERLLKPRQMCKVDKLTKDESIMLFSLHAFAEDYPIQSYKMHTKRAIKICEGLPLALKVIARISLESIPVEFSSENLMVVALHHSRLEQVWKQTPRTPNFLGLPNFERLILKGCVSLVEVCELIENLEILDLLDLQDCKSLWKLPRNIGKLRSLRTLVILGCNISELPSEMRNSGDVKWWPRIIWSIVPTPRKGLETLLDSLPCSLRVLSLSFDLELNGLSINAGWIIEAGNCMSLEKLTSLNGIGYL
ncbi:hypothetical protein LguiA_008365 [Lonicera macranthoides]